MTDKDRLDAFFGRLQADPNLLPIAVMLSPYRTMMGDPAAMVATLDALATHWTAARGPATVEAVT